LPPHCWLLIGEFDVLLFLDVFPLGWSVKFIGLDFCVQFEIQEHCNLIQILLTFCLEINQCSTALCRCSPISILSKNLIYSLLGSMCCKRWGRSKIM
jgi:hypothetical protein